LLELMNKHSRVDTWSLPICSWDWE
jgi:hypothetical protein